MARLVSLLVLVLLAAGCGGGGAPSSSLAALNGEWRLTSGTGPAGDVDLDDGVEVTLTIDGEDWGGQVCNHYGGEEVEIGDGTVSMSGVISTEMACLEPGWMEAEAAYLDAFRQVDAYEVTPDELVLTGDGVELRYEPVAAEAPAALIGTVWVLDTMIEGSGPDGTASSTLQDHEATLEFLEDGSIVASSGCLTREDGTYEVDGSQLRTAFESAYDYECEGDQLWAQDTHVWRVLGDDPTFEIDGQRLTLTAGELGSGYQARG